MSDDQEIDPQIKLNQQMIFVTWIIAGIAFLGLLVAFSQGVMIKEQQETTKKQLRAYVHLKDIASSPIKAEVTNNIIGYTFAPIFQNFGSTPTKNFQSWTSIQWFHQNEIDHYDFSKPAKNIDLNLYPIMDLGPTATTQQAVNISIEDIEKVNNGVGTIIIWGHVKYSDIFSDTSMRLTDFCMRLVPIKDINGEFKWQYAAFKSTCNSFK